MARLLVWSLLLIAVLFGTPYASVILYWVMGPWNAVAIEADGSTTTMEFGPGVTRPDWVPILPEATIVQSTRLVSRKHPAGVGILDLATRAELDEVKQFYVDRLASLGFTVTDEGVGPLTTAGAEFLGVANMLAAERPASDDQMNILIRTSEGSLVPSRLIQITWRKLSSEAAAHR